MQTWNLVKNRVHYLNEGIESDFFPLSAGRLIVEMLLSEEDD